MIKRGNSAVHRIMIQKIYPKILMLIFSSSLFFIILYFSLYRYIKEVEKQAYSNSEIQFNNEVATILDLEANPINVAINNDTNWDEFVDFIRTKDTAWYNKTIATELDIYKADYLGAYDIDGTFIIRTASSKVKSEDIIPKKAMMALNSLGFSKFYCKIPEGVLEISGATIHPSDDPLKNKTKPYGYFFVGRLVDSDFVKKLERITSSEVKFIKIGQEKTIENHAVYSAKILMDSESKPLVKMLFKRKFGVYFENTLEILFLIIAAFLINLIVNIFFTRKLVYTPLNLITRVLETGNRKAIEILKSTTGEFKHIGALFEENANQKNELVRAKLKAEEGERLKASFLANLSHEIRTPMNAINGFTNLLINNKMDERERLEYLKIIDKSGSNLVSIIDDLIEMSKIDSNQMTPNYGNVNLESCIRELYETIKITIPKSKKINFFIQENEHPVEYNILTDEVKLKQILVNLITNAIKFTDKGYVSFGYTIDQNYEKIIFKVKDTGLGIEKKNQKYVFDRFKRVDGDAGIKAGGLGLGLAISKAYVEMMGGTISVVSEIDEGSLFSFSIPLQYDEVHQITVQHVFSKKNENFNNDRKTILVAEDDNINFLLFQKIIQSTNYNIIRAVNGLEAVDICLRNPTIDLILMDIKMPIMNGFEALDKVKSIRPELDVVAQTAYASKEDEDRVFAAGFSGFITKPIKRDVLFATIDQFLKT